MKSKALVFLFCLLFAVSMAAYDINFVSVHYDIYIGGLTIYVGHLVDNGASATWRYAGDDVVLIGTVSSSGTDVKIYVFQNIIIKKSGSNWEIIADANCEE